MKHFDLSEVSMTYTSKITGQTIDRSTTMVTIPDPHHRYDVTMGDRHLSFMACDVFDALERLLAGGDAE